jgi:hypothetical protein
MTPKKAIYLRCKDCQPERKENIDELCKNCSLKNPKLSNLKKIKTYCKYCCNEYNPSEYCRSLDCSLYIFREGNNIKMKKAQSLNKNIGKTIKKTTDYNTFFDSK